MATTPAREAALRATYGDALVERIRNARLLVVGAGGIGCELLKNLVLDGFGCGERGEIEVVDLDTIDVSNLNRQFLFRSRHVGHYKALVAKEAVTGFNPAAGGNITALRANVITDGRFTLDHVAGFDLVLNALDNIKARTHINRLCAARKVPLIESGTTGYKGQTQAIRGGLTECYECVAKAKPKQFPLCTIRNTPEKPVHCIVWAKMLHALLFGVADLADPAAANTSGLWEPAVSTEGTPSVYMDKLNPPSAELLAAADAAAAGSSGGGGGGGDGEAAAAAAMAPLRAWAAGALDAMFGAHVADKLATGAYEKALTVPTPLSHAAAAAGALEAGTEGLPARQPADAASQQRVWGPQDSARVFVETLAGFWADGAARKRHGAVSFDKDDGRAMRFVAAASNLRARVFGIPLQSLYAAKGVAGNIVPAIATTNAIVAGLQVQQAIRVLQLRLAAEEELAAAGGGGAAAKAAFEAARVAAAGAAAEAAGEDAGAARSKAEAEEEGVPEKHTAWRNRAILSACKMNWCNNKPDGRGYFIQANALEPPNPCCLVCPPKGVVPRLDFTLDSRAVTLADFLRLVGKGELGLQQPEVDQLWEADDEDLDPNLAWSMEACVAAAGLWAGAGGGGEDSGVTAVGLSDYAQGLEFEVRLWHADALTEAELEAAVAAAGGDEAASAAGVGAEVVKGRAPGAHAVGSPQAAAAAPAAAAAQAAAEPPRAPKRAREGAAEEEGGAGGEGKRDRK